MKKKLERKREFDEDLPQYFSLFVTTECHMATGQRLNLWEDKARIKPGSIQLLSNKAYR
jgi:hypothetical protein